MDRSRLGIVIPAFNESQTITAVVTSALKYGVPIVVDDGSSDDTAVLAASAGGTVVKHSINLGYDRALNSGFVKADESGCEYVVTMDADGQHNPDILEEYTKLLDEGADVVIGTRDRRQRVAEHVFAWVANVKWGILDPLCGMKAYRISTYRALGHFDSYDSVGTELAVFAAKSGLSISQLPIKTRDRVDAPRFGNRFTSNKRIMRALWNGLLLKVT